MQSILQALVCKARYQKFCISFKLKTLLPSNRTSTPALFYVRHEMLRSLLHGGIDPFLAMYVYTYIHRLLPQSEILVE